VGRGENGVGRREKEAGRGENGVGRKKLITDSGLMAGDVFFSLKMRLISAILGHTVSVTKHYITQVAFPLLP
jgi:hypothetical protein